MIDERRLAPDGLRDGCVHVWTFAADSDGPIAQRRLVRGRVRKILASYLKCPPERVPIERPARGKPALRAAGTRGLAYSVTHSGSFAFVAVASGRRVGIDLERIRPTADVAALARRFFSREEGEAIASLRDGARRKGFFRAWTRKEAYLKGAGGTVPADLRRFSVDVGRTGTPRIGWTNLEGAGPSAWVVRDLDAPDGYVAALAVEGNLEEVVQLAA